MFVWIIRGFPSNAWPRIFGEEVREVMKIGGQKSQIEEKQDEKGGKIGEMKGVKKGEKKGVKKGEQKKSQEFQSKIKEIG